MYVVLQYEVCIILGEAPPARRDPQIVIARKPSQALRQAIIVFVLGLGSGRSVLPIGISNTATSWYTL